MLLEILFLERGNKSKCEAERKGNETCEVGRALFLQSKAR
jgi:hypothetical protein